MSQIKFDSLESKKVMLEVSYFLMNEKDFYFKKNFYFKKDKLVDKRDKLVKLSQEFTFYVSKTFYDFVETGKFQSEQSDALEILKFYKKKNVDFEIIKESLLNPPIKLSLFDKSSIDIPTDQYQAKYGEIGEYFKSECKNPILTNIIMDEWIFLNEYSIILSNLKRFVTLLENGIITVIKYSKRAFDWLLKKYDKLVEKKFPSNHLITNAHRLRLLAKFIIIGLKPYIGYIFNNNPTFQTIAGLVDCILIFDPKTN